MHKYVTQKRKWGRMKNGRSMVTSELSVESNVSLGGRSGRGASGAFTLAVEVSDRGWKVVMVSGCQPRSLFQPILSVTAGEA